MNTPLRPIYAQVSEICPPLVGMEITPRDAERSPENAEPVVSWSSRAWCAPLADPTYQRQVMDRISRSISIRDSGCWEWQRWITHDGYGKVSIKKKMVAVHQVTLSIHRGGIWPTDLQVDHLCRNRVCCNPAHLELVTPRENTVRGRAPLAAKERGRARTHCVHNHPFDDSNTYSHPITGYRTCRPCRSRRERARTARKTATS